MRLDTEERYYRFPVKYKEYQSIIYQPGKVARIILNRPRYRNAMSHPLWGEMEDAFDRAAADKECIVIVLSGAGSCFSAGDDAIGLTPESAPVLVDRRPPEQLMKDYGSESEVWHQYNIEHDYYISWLGTHKLRTLPKPTIAMVHGYCIFAGFSLASDMDVIFASEEALFLPAGGASSALWDWGPRKCFEIGYEHRFLTARECMESRMVNRVFPNYESLERETLAFANRVAENWPERLRSTKEGILEAMNFQGRGAQIEASRHPFFETWRQDAIDGHRQRVEGRGRARTPRALEALKLKLESEGKEVPKHVREAVERAAQRNDLAAQQRAFTQSWRDPARVARAEAEFKAYEEARKKDEGQAKKARTRK
ncbi:MAG: enoyl-CoA hydratase/isomerase family protein [Chloroflexi bacterium]|nr:enoyl-CoA hydratase/isomerase family protein [Chloroflexota bacterium]